MSTSPAARRRHVLYLHQYFVPPGGAGGTRSYEFARRLVERGHRVTLITSSAMLGEAPRAAGTERRTIDGIELLIAHVPYDNRFGFFARILAFLRFSVHAAWLAMTVPDVDIVFATSTPLTIILPGWLAARRHRAPLVFEVRDLWPEMPIAIGALRNGVLIRLARWLERFAYRASERVVALSSGMAEGVAATGYPRDRIVIVPNAADLELFGAPRESVTGIRERLPAIIGRPVVTYAGTFGQLNDVPWLVHMARHLADHMPEALVVLVGDGIDADRVRVLARTLDLLERNVIVSGKLPKPLIAELFAASDVLVSVVLPLPAAEANSANKFFDSLAAGRPVLLNYGGWQADLLRAHEAGLVVPYDSPERAARDLAALLADRARCEAMGRNARRLAERSFDRDRLFERFAATIEAACGDAPPAVPSDGAASAQRATDAVPGGDVPRAA